jgi:hypothetical protein
MAEMEEQFGGAAEAAYDPITNLKNTISELAGSIGSLLLPIISQLVAWIKPMIDGVTQWVQSHQTLATVLAAGAAALGIFLLAGGALLTFLATILPLLSTIGAISLPAFAAGAAGAGAAMIPLASGITALGGALMTLSANPAFWAIIAVMGIASIGFAGFGISSAVNSISSLTSSGNVPAMASGGIITSPTLALIGESGPEAVVPLSRGGIGAGGNNYNNTFNITVQGKGSNTDTAREIYSELLKLKSQNGSLGL